jgi:hypothetical protein
MVRTVPYIRAIGQIESLDMDAIREEIASEEKGHGHDHDHEHEHA